MADVNRAWISVDLGNFNVGRKVSAFFGGDNYQEAYGNLASAFGELAAAQIIGHLAQLTTEEAFDNLKQGGLVGNLAAGDSNSSTRSADGPVCKHGPKQYKEGMGAKGKWRAYFCPAPKGTPDQCQPEWIK